MVANASKIINGKVLIFEEYYALAPKGVGYPATLKKVVKVHEPRFVPVAQVKTAPPVPPKSFKRGLVPMLSDSLKEALAQYGVLAPSLSMSALIDALHSNPGQAVKVFDLAFSSFTAVKVRMEQKQAYDCPVVRFYKVDRK